MPEDRQGRQQLRSSRGQQRRRQRSVFQYITILFAAALVLLLYTFMMERRQFELKQQQSQESISDLQQQSVSAVQTLQGMTEENTQLKEQVEALEQQLQDAQAQLDSTKDGQSQIQVQLQNQERAVRAMDWFWQIDEAYVRSDTALCRELIQSFEATGLSDALPQLSVTETGRYSPAERYLEIYEKVI